MQTDRQMTFLHVCMFCYLCNYPVSMHNVSYRFSDAHCKKCIVGLLKRGGDAYKSGRKQNNFVMDLMKLDIPELLLVKSAKEHEPNVEYLFNEMIRGFIQRNALRDVIISQVVPIMVSNMYLMCTYICIWLRIYPFLAKSSTTISLVLFALYDARFKMCNRSSATHI